MRLVWDGARGSGFIEANGAFWAIAQKPALPFEYDGIFWRDGGDAVHLRGDGQHPLTAEEVAAVRGFLDATIPPTPEPPSAAVVEGQLVEAVQHQLDATARTRGYDGILPLCTYAASAVATFAAEGQAGVAWRDAVWAHCYTVLADVQAGRRPAPTAAELVAELPAINW